MNLDRPRRERPVRKEIASDLRTRTEKLRDYLAANGARLLWRVPGPNDTELLAFTLPPEAPGGVVIIHDYGPRDGYDAYTQDQTRGTHQDIGRAILRLDPA